MDFRTGLNDLNIIKAAMNGSVLSFIAAFDNTALTHSKFFYQHSQMPASLLLIINTLI
ncbi:hypothetical protein JCM15457_2325 [Liquorilactobacillus sucicola DSM 21376 = JCM 15457]|nr:hypothetical protein JCM15457_2325 [Liquorilactobacillus sucicola DSM 21376 = JCM 15457]